MGRLLIVADDEFNCSATRRGLELAAKLGHEVDVVAFTYASLKSLKVTQAKRDSLRKHLLSERKKVVLARINEYRKRGQKVGLTVVWEKDLARWLIDQCQRDGYTMVVKTGSRSASLFHTSTDWQLLRECPAPLLLVAKQKWHSVKPVLATLDLSSKAPAKQALNRKVLGEAQALARTLGVELNIIAAFEVPALLSELDLVDPLAYARDAKEAMKPQIRKLAKQYGIPESTFHYKRGPVEKVITSYAAKVRAQIVVMGTVGRKGVRARLLGNTAERVLQGLKTDVLAIKP
jgi:universal stress protein E